MAANRTALITGASAGIGTAFAREFARHGYDIVLVARRQDKLEEIAGNLRRDFDVAVLVIAADLAAEDANPAIVAQLENNGVHVDALINNAGYALTGGFLEPTWDEHRAMLQVMLNGYTELTYLLLPGMLERGFGRIINVSSLSAMAPPSKGSLYSAIKRYVNDFSAAVDFEFRERGIHCTAVCPGFTYTEFHDVMGVREATNKFPKYVWQSAEAVAAEGYDAVMKGKVIKVTGRLNRFIAALLGLMPRALTLHFGRTSRTFED